MVIVLMGVAGSGKTTVGQLLARELNWAFFDGDDFHPAANIEKLRAGIPLNDRDRKPWLQAIREHIETLIERRTDAVLACSALKDSYRKTIRASEEALFVYLAANPELIRERLHRRAGHFMNPALLESQFDTLEEPADALTVDASLSPGEIVRRIRDHFAI